VNFHIIFFVFSKVTIKKSNENLLEEDENNTKNNPIESDQLFINIKSIKSLEKHLSSSSVSSSSSSTSSSSSSSSKGSKHSSSSSSNAANLNKTKSNRIKKNNNNKRKIKNEYNSALASLNPSNQRNKIAVSNRKNLHQPNTQTIVNINTENRIDNINNEPQHSHHHLHQHLNVTNDSNNNDEENDTDILDESDSDLEPSLNKISTGNSGISDEENETDETRLNFHNSNILINHRYYQQQQQQHLFQQYNTYNDQENDPHKPVLNSKQPKPNRHKNIKVNKVKTSRNNNNNNNNNNIANSNIDSSRNLKIKIKKNNLKESKLGINKTHNNNKDELNNSEDEYEQRPLRQSIGLNQNVNSEQNHVKHTGTINENHDSFITAETIEEVKEIQQEIVTYNFTSYLVFELKISLFLFTDLMVLLLFMLKK
jgi:hypothetical protein